MDPRKHYLLHGQNEHRKYRRLDLADLTTSPLLVLRRIKRRSFLRKLLKGIAAYLADGHRLAAVAVFKVFQASSCLV